LEIVMVALGLVAEAVLVFSLSATAVPAAEPPAGASAAPKSEIVGVWKGTSTCVKTEGNESCRDETVVYNVVDVPNLPSTVLLKAARFANDIVRPMYELEFIYHSDTATWSCEFERPRFSGVWTYAIHGDEMTGTAKLVPSMTVVRNVSAKRVPQEDVSKLLP
jgi:hypothetical protein